MIASRLAAAMRGRSRAGLAIFALCASLGSCVLVDSMFSSDEAPPFAFSHRVHVIDQGLGCADCHRQWDKAENPGMPSAAQCAVCHNELDKEKPPEKQVTSLFDGRQYRKSSDLALSEELVFSHVKHATRGDECAACHAELGQGDRTSEQGAITMDGCTVCHEDRKASNDCAVCHTVIRAEVAPDNHHQDWKRGHGPTARARTGETIDRCDLCHEKSSCDSCHKVELPENHNSYWRHRGHGLVASMDRQNCSTCHIPDSCDRCHAETKPMDHTGAFGAPQDRHCITCHEPLRSQGCFVCHKSAPSHALATPMPPDHLPGMNCRMCHGNGAPLPHVDNGDSCTKCHM